MSHRESNVSATLLRTARLARKARQETISMIVVALVGVCTFTLFAWERVIDGASTFDSADTLALDEAGNAFAAGRILGSGKTQDFTVVKVLGSNGSEQWRGSVPAFLGTVGGVCVP